MPERFGLRRVVAVAPDDWAAGAVAAFARQYPAAWARQSIPEAEIAALVEASDGDPVRFQRFLKRRLHGDPLAYILGHVTFAGRRFLMDRRAYATDPETIHLVTAVKSWVQAQQRPIHAAEIGVGAGALAITLLLDAPNVRVTGLELDGGAAGLCRENAARHGVKIDVVESDLLSSWGDRPAPDVLYGDLPWGDETTLYGEDRDADHYHRMPPTTAFPLSGRTGAHQDLVRAVRARGWTTPLWLNCGTLPDGDIADIVAAAEGMRAEVVTAAPTARLLHLVS